MQYVPLLTLGIVFVYVLIVLGPLTRLVKQESDPSVSGRFSTMDLASLMFLVPLPPAIFNAVNVNMVGDVAANGISMFMGAIVWYAGLRALNHIGVENQMKRIVGIGFTFPFALIGGFSLATVFHWMVTSSIGQFLYVIGFSWAGAWIVFITITLLSWISAKWVAEDCLLQRKLEAARAR